jgi:hypothetical protein
MQCRVCGMEYGLSHNCSGVAPALSAEEAAPVPQGFAPTYYMRLALNIARWDDVAIRRASRDANALLYGAIFSTFSAAIIFLVTALPKMLTREGATAGTIFWGLLLGLVFVWVYMSAITLLQFGFCHLIARWFLGATGTFFGVIRPLLLAWFVNGLILIPVVGPLAAGIAWTAVLMMVFEEVDGIGRLAAFLISAGINGVFLALQYFLPH